MIKVLSDNALRAYIPLLPAVKTRTAPSRYVKMLMHHLSMQRYVFFLSVSALVSIKLSTILQNAVTLMKKNNEEWGTCALLLVCFLLAKLCLTPNPLKGAVVGVFMGVKVPFRGFRGSRNCRFCPYLKLLNFCTHPLCTAQHRRKKLA